MVYSVISGIFEDYPQRLSAANVYTHDVQSCHSIQLMILSRDRMTFNPPPVQQSLTFLIISLYFSLKMNNTSNGQESSAQPKEGNIIWAVVFSIMTCAIILSNILTITIFVRTRLKRVRKRTHYLLVSLTCADLMVGCLSSPLFIRDLIYPLEHRGNSIRQAVHEVLDITSGFASILSLTSIALDRLIAVRWPLQHRSATNSFYILAIAMPWLVAIVISLFYLLGYIWMLLPPYVLSSVAVACLSTSLFIITLSYSLVWAKVRRRHWRPQCQRIDKERRLTQTLMTLTVASLVSWLPFEVLLVIVHFCSQCREPFTEKLSSVSLIFKLLQFSNSFMNTVVYSLRIPEYKRSLRQLFRKPCKNDVAIPLAYVKTARLTSLKKYIRSPLMSSPRTRRSLVVLDTMRNVGQVPSYIITNNSPLMTKRLAFS